jgi:opacity protein-like surface antigen
LCATSSAFAGEARLLLTGLYAPATLRFSESRSFVEYAEPASLEASLSMKSGFGVELGGEYDFTSHVGLRLSLSGARRSGAGRYEARLPHPLYLDRDRVAEASLPGLQYQASAASLDAVLLLGEGKLRVSLLAGTGPMRVEADVVGELHAMETYPYDSVDVSASKLRLHATPFEYGGALGLDCDFGHHLGVGAQARYSHTRASLRPPAGAPIDLDAGGLQVGVGLRFRF